MTPQEIQALINAKIAGQGSAVDVGGALPVILSEILNLASAQPETHVLEILEQGGTADEPLSKETALSFLLLDGVAPSFEDLQNINPLNTIVIFRDGGESVRQTFTISEIMTASSFYIRGGMFQDPNNDVSCFEIGFYQNGGWVVVSES